jgi:hypothetical protein
MIYYTNEANGERRAEATCALCGARFDGLIQSKSRAGDWTPSAESTLGVLGWLAEGALWFCGRGCRDKFSYGKLRGYAVTPVTRLADASYQATRPTLAAKGTK